MPKPKKSATKTLKKIMPKREKAAPPEVKRKKVAKPQAMPRAPRPPPEDIFWADSLAEQIIERAKKEGRIATCKAAASPSGGKHIGNMFDVLKSWIVYKAVRRKYPDARFVHTSDDMDPLRTVPVRLPSLDGKWESTEPMKDKISSYLGYPYVNVPDPFGCCRSWAEHFTRVWTDGFSALGMPENEVKLFSNKSLYEEGAFDPYIEKALKDSVRSAKILSRFQEHVPAGYIPFHAVCENCGKITTTVTAFDLANRTVKYTCTGRELAGKYVISGCNHSGEVPWHKGKLPWRFEWPAQWGVLGVTFEPFGKEHAEGSWPSGQAIAREIYGIEPPIPHVYEFMLIDGEKMAARIGNAYLTQEMLEILEPEVFAYFYTKRSGKQRNLDIKSIYRLADEFERAERIYFGAEEEQNASQKATLMREYESAMPKIPASLPLRIEYQFAAMVSQISPDLERAIKMLRASGHIKSEHTLHAEEQGMIAKRLSLAKNWVERFAPEQKVNINERVPHEVLAKLSFGQRTALKDLAKLLESDVTQPILYNSFYEIAKKNSISNQEFFRALYLALMSKTSGPRAAAFIMALGPQRVGGILEKV